MTRRHRARSIDELKTIQMKIFGGAAQIAGQSPPLAIRPDDVVITPFSKSGTTWLQQIFHQLRTGGDMDFDDISRVVPWIEMAPMEGIDLNEEQRATPRGFKSHEPYDRLPPGGRYINSVRHPADVAWSLYKFMEGWFLEPGALTPDEFVQSNFLANDNYFDHFLSYWQVRHQENVLILSYEGMLEDPAGTIERVANFCGIPLDEALFQRVLERSSIDYMLQYKDRFDDAILRAITEEEILPPGSDSAKVRQGTA
ncbi:MAG: sulfotransferase domain-containing protein, partial [Proteobacteria bacterium]|nr:sulfotransferase domain-containing protein [Pseudomonadota bacterium]